MAGRFPDWSRCWLRLFCPILIPVLILAAAFSLGAPAPAETLTIQNPGSGSVSLAGKWQFRKGDDLSWANPAFDDSGWEEIGADKTWGAQTHPSYTSFAWYRRHIQIDNSNPAQTKNLAILIPPVDDVYDLYWNGKKIGSYGAMPPNATWWSTGHSVVYALPPDATDGVLALRVWKAPLSTIDPSTNGGLEGVPVLGDRDILAAQAKLPFYTNDETGLPSLLISAVVLVVGVFSLLLYFRDRSQGLYLWLALYLVASGLHGLENLSAFNFDLTFRATQLATQFLECFQDISMWMILLFLFGMAKDPRWKRATTWLIVLYLSAQLIDVVTIFVWSMGISALPWIDAITTAVYCTLPLYIFFIVGFGLKRRKQLTLWPLIVVACLDGFYSWFFQLAGQGVRFTHWTMATRLRSIGVAAGGSFFGITFILNTLLFLALIFTIAREQFLERERQSRIELEIKSAQEVQKILVPEQTPAIPGFSIASIYRPAEEVGGDFFQVIPAGSGGALVVLGDVSGKGLKAAMTVSLIVGTLRTLADYTQSPAEILIGLNRRLLGRTDGGFATCVVARIDADGGVALANAGHMAPFRNETELPVAGSLPLGLTPDAAYDELDFRLQEDGTLTFYTDGMVEATNETGELFGFERVAGLVAAHDNLEQMVKAACAFGQMDDITVLQVKRLPLTAPAHINLTAQFRRAVEQPAGASGD
jgi:hypothetical protein